MQIKSDEVNYLIYRYLIEAGFSHSAFTLSHECNVSRLHVRPDQVSPGTLVNLLHKGLQFLNVERHVNEDGSMRRCTQPMSILEKHVCVFTEAEFHTEREDTPVVRQVVTKKDREQLSNAKFSTTDASQKYQPAAAKERASIETNQSVALNIEKQKVPSISVPASGTKVQDPHFVSRISDDQLTLLQGHSAEIYSCAWNSTGELLATGSGDSTARIWSIVPQTESTTQRASSDHASQASSDIHTTRMDKFLIESISLNSPDAVGMDDDKKGFIITALEWDPTGNFLAAGTSNGSYCVWDKSGSLKFSVAYHSASIFAFKWNPNGKVILCGGEDSSVSIVDSDNGALIYSCKSHSGSVMDVDWKSQHVFTSCSQDTTIKLYFNNAEGTDSLECYKSFEIASVNAHDKEINAISWDPSGNFLVSCSDDKTAKVWTCTQANTLSLLHTLTGHTDGIYTVEWNPNPSLPHPTVATASFDGTVRLWNVETGSCLHILARHSKSVYSISFTGDGQFLASGSVDKNVYVWNTSNGNLLYQYTCKGGIYDLNWNPHTNLLVVCTTKSSAYMLDVPIQLTSSNHKSLIDLPTANHNSNDSTATTITPMSF